VHDCKILNTFFRSEDSATWMGDRYYHGYYDNIHYYYDD